ncbi:MAG: hypothetical protein BGO69_17040 [Bacteroidetes bacterium 46-16]|nr:MAG: hypothetical protein BGO69_17040 [Bacteroidetes bacterium 46-16]
MTTTQKAWAIYYKGNKAQKGGAGKRQAPGIASWNRSIEIYESRKKAISVMNNEFKAFKYPPKEQKLFKVVRCTISYEV